MIRRLRDYYRQFEELSPEEISRELLERRDAERARAVVELPGLDLTTPGWHEPPHPEAVNAATYALRRSINAYPDPAPLRDALAAAHGVEPEHVVAGHGAGELLRAAFAAIAGDGPAEARGAATSGAEAAVAWPGWGPLPRLVDEARATPVPVALTAGGAPDPDALLAAAGPATRAVVLCTPNDPTGAAVPPASLRRLAERLAERVWLVVDSALAEFAPDDPGGLAGLLAARERVVVVRSFSKAHAMAGFRTGFAVTGDPALRERLAPFAGVAAPAQAAMLWATEHGAAVVARRRAVAAGERARLRAALGGTGLAFADGHGPLVWLSASDHDGRALASHLARRRIFVTPGPAWGEDRHVRVVLRGPEATDRLATALRELELGTAAG